MLFSKSRAREKQEYTFAKQQYSPYFSYLLLHITPFLSSFTRIDVTRHFILNPLGFAPTPHFVRPTSLASSLFLSRFAQSTRLAPQTTRFAQTIK
jgi:hypothetical protein